MSGRVHVGAARIDPVTLVEAATDVVDAARDHRRLVVVTPNVQHIVMLEDSPSFRSAYDRADLVLADGFPVALLARLTSRLPITRVPGSDLLPLVLASLPPGTRVLMIGSSPDAGALLGGRYPDVVVAHEPAPATELADEAGRDQLVARCALGADNHDIIVIALGAPKQELLAADIAGAGAEVPVLCVGAAVDYLVGTRPRAPEWMQRAGLEWLFRAGTEPRRLGRRYAGDALPFLRIALSMRRSRRRSPDSSAAGR